MSSGGDTPEMNEAAGREWQKMQQKLALYEGNGDTVETMQFKKQLQAIRDQRNQDLASGRARGNQLFGEGSLGRVDANRSQEVSDIISRRQKEAEGFTKEEQNAFRDQNLNASNQSLAGQMRQLRMQQAQSGVRGPVASAQRTKLMSDAQSTNAANERDLFLKNIDARRAGLNSLESSIGNARKDELDRQQFNIGQQNKEKYGQITTELGYGSLGSGEAAAVLQKMAADKNADATITAAQNSGGGGLCCFIFLEARYGDGTMDSVVRRYRDENMTEKNRRGYYKLSEVLVPLMRKSKIVKFCVRTVMTDPMVAYGKAHYKTGSKLGLLCKPIVNFWVSLFDYLGGDHPFIRENGEVV